MARRPQARSQRRTYKMSTARNADQGSALRDALQCIAPMEIKNRNYREFVLNTIFAKATFLSELGIQLTDAGPGWCTAIAELSDRHLQHSGYVHAGVITTLSDHTCGGAAATLISSEENVLAVEFKINFLRPAATRKLRCKATVLKAGKRLFIVESDVFAVDNEKEVHVSTSLETVAVVR
jgi:uncharacterized protein (TIGR00369 family)